MGCAQDGQEVGCGMGHNSHGPSSSCKEKRGGSPTETEVRWGKVMVYVQPGQFWGQGQTGQGPQPAG